MRGVREGWRLCLSPEAAPQAVEVVGGCWVLGEVARVYNGGEGGRRVPRARPGMGERCPGGVSEAMEGHAQVSVGVSVRFEGFIGGW